MGTRANSGVTAVLVLALTTLWGCAPTPVARLLGGSEVVSEGAANKASLWGSIGGREPCVYFERPVLVVLKGPGLPPEGVVSTPLDPSAEGGDFRFFNLQPGSYTLSLRPPPGQTRALFRSGECDRTILVEPGEVSVTLREGESKEVHLELVYVKNSPDVPLASPWGIPMMDWRSTESGVSFSDADLNSLPIPPASSR